MTIKEIIGTRDRFGVGDDGIVYNLTTGKQRRGTPNDQGYSTLQFVMADGKRKTFSVHRLVSIYHIPNPNNLGDVNHKNGIKTDNRIENLEWVTRSQNIIHAIRAGLGAQNKLAMKEVLAIRSVPKSKGIQKELAIRYGVTASAINAIVNNKSWN